MQLQDPDESIYDLPLAPREQDGYNAGGVHFDLTVTYLTDYVFRGVDQSERLAGIGTGDDAALPGGGGGGGGGGDVGNEDAPNLQFDGFLEFDLGKLPHPVAGLFVNIYDDDPGSEFQEIRPYVGFEWDIRPFTVAGGHVSYIYPEREALNTAEVWARVTFNDSLLWNTERPVLSPYIYAAYDYELYVGVYAEAGVRHEFVFEDLDLTLTAVADVAYVDGHSFFTEAGTADPEFSGFQHYDIGLIGTYSLNDLLNIPRRYGRWTLNGYLYYTDGIEEGLHADTQTWGGVGLRFQY